MIFSSTPIYTRFIAIHCDIQTGFSIRGNYKHKHHCTAYNLDKLRSSCIFLLLWPFFKQKDLFLAEVRFSAVFKNGYLKKSKTLGEKCHSLFEWNKNCINPQEVSITLNDHLALILTLKIQDVARIKPLKLDQESRLDFCIMKKYNIFPLHIKCVKY